MVSVPDWLLLTAQWMHLMGAVTWVGGSIFFKFVLQPAFRKVDAGPAPMRSVGHEFGRIVWIAIGILVVTGAFMALVHLTAGGNSRVYIGILALKISLAFYMFLLVWLRRRSAPAAGADGSVGLWRRTRRFLTSTTTLLVLGIVVIGLADVLSAVGGHGDGGHSHGGHSEEVESTDHADAHDASDDHHKPVGVVEEETEVPATPHPADDHHASDEAEPDETPVLETPEPTEEVESEESDDHRHDHGEDDGHGHDDEGEDEDEEENGHGDDEEDGHGHGH